MFKATDKAIEMVKNYFTERNIEKPIRIVLSEGG
jgi:hypothetical protein